MDSGFAGLQTWTCSRQTDPRWFRRYSLPAVGLAWGIDLGLGFSTVRVTSLFWLALLFALFVPAVAAPVVLSTYGVSFAVGLMVVLVYSRRSGRDVELFEPFWRLSPTARRLGGCLELGLAASLFAAAAAGARLV